MIKKALLTGLLVFTGGLSAANETKHCTCNVYEFTTKEKIIIGGLVGGSVIIAAPYVLGAATIAKIAVAIKAAVTAVTPYVVPTTTVGKVGLGLTAAQSARPCIVQTTEEKLNRLLEEKASKHIQAKAEFISCLKANKANSLRSASGRPMACEDAALLYALNSSIPELNKKTEAFKNGKCLCS
jgi:hypothetical protein